jgi:iron complex transport system substrate-binding protein
MKTKNKTMALVEIAIVLCSLFLVALPAIAAEHTAQEVSANTITTASEDDFVLDVYGNANEDDTVDMRDLTYVKLIFFGKKTETELADAKYDGKINPLDFIQIKLIIVGKEKELTLVDTADRIVTVKKPIERIVSLNLGVSEVLRSLKAKDRIVGVDCYTKEETVFFPELSELPSIGGPGGGHPEPDYEKILELDPDIAITYGVGWGATPIEDILEPAGITVVRLDFYKPMTMVEEIEKLGYILDTRNEAGEFIDFYEEYLNSIKEKTEDLSEEDKKEVYYEINWDYYTINKDSGMHRMIEIAGGINIGADLSAEFVEISPEWIIREDPDIIIRDEYKVANGYEVDDPTEMKEERDAILSRTELTTVTAIKDERVYMVSCTMIESGRHFIAIGYLAKWFHPVLFDDLDPRAIHQEYLDRFQELDFDVYEHGVFVFPEPS